MTHCSISPAMSAFFAFTAARSSLGVCSGQIPCFDVTEFGVLSGRRVLRASPSLAVVNALLLAKTRLRFIPLKLQAAKNCSESLLSYRPTRLSVLLVVTSSFLPSSFPSPAVFQAMLPLVDQAGLLRLHTGFITRLIVNLTQFSDSSPSYGC